MVRLMLVLAPVMCILSGIAVSSLLSTYMKQIDEVKTDKKKAKFEGNYFMRSEVSIQNLVLDKLYCSYSCYIAFRIITFIQLAVLCIFPFCPLLISLFYVFPPPTCP